MSATDSGAEATVRITAETPDVDRVVEAARRASDDVAVIEVGPTGAPFPLCLCTIDGTTAFHANPGPADVADLTARLAEGDLATAAAHAVVDHDPETETMPTPEDGPLSVGRRMALGPCGWVEPGRPPDPIGANRDPPVDARVDEVGLRGRGRADGASDDSIAALWERARAADGDPVVVVHAANTDADADDLLCRGAPAHVLDTADLVADVVGATDTVAFATDVAATALQSVESDAVVQTAPNSFRVGEPTMALEALEGSDRIEARRRPPGPGEWGLYGRPTVIHTPRTLMQLRALLTGEQFDSEHADPGTRLTTVRGAVSGTATVEIPTTQSLSTALSAVDTEGDRYVVGGRFGGFTRSLDVPASAPALSSAELGTAGVVEVLDPEKCVVAAVGERVAFARRENCGRCVPCREGTVQLHELLREIYDGTFDDEGIRSLSRVVESTSLCAFGAAAARPVQTALDAFEPAFRAHAGGTCATGYCEGLQ